MTDIDREFNAMCDREGSWNFKPSRPGLSVAEFLREKIFAAPLRAKWVELAIVDGKIEPRLTSRDDLVRAYLALTQTHNTTEDHDR